MTTSLKRNAAGALIRNAVTGALCSTCCSYTRFFNCSYLFRVWIAGGSAGTRDVWSETRTVFVNVEPSPGYYPFTWYEPNNFYSGLSYLITLMVTYEGEVTITPSVVALGRTDVTGQGYMSFTNPVSLLVK